MKYTKEELDEYIYFCQYQKKLDIKTVRAYRNDLNQYIRFIEDNYDGVVDKNSIKSYFVFLHMNFKQKSVKRKIASLKAYYAYLEDEEKIEYNPIRKVNTKFKEEIILPRSIPFDIIEALLSFMYGLRKDNSLTQWNKRILLRDIAVTELLFASGMRISELCNLKDQLFNLSDRQLCIKGKGGKERYLQIENDNVMNILGSYRHEFKDSVEKSGYFFVNRYGERLSEQSARNMIYKYTKKAAIDMHITPHMFRHAFATLLLEEDVDIRYIQKMLGHSSIVTTQIYTNVAMKKQSEILRNKHPRNRLKIG